MSRSDRGSVAVELALLLPLLLIVIAGLVDFGHALRVQLQLQDAVADGVSYAVKHPSSATQTRQRVADASAGLGLTEFGVTITCSMGTPVVVTVRGTISHDWLVGLLVQEPLTMTAEGHGDVMSTTGCVSIS